MPTGQIAFLALVIAALAGFAICLAAVAADYTKWRARQPAAKHIGKPGNARTELKLAA